MRVRELCPVSKPHATDRTRGDRYRPLTGHDMGSRKTDAVPLELPNMSYVNDIFAHR